MDFIFAQPALKVLFWTLQMQQRNATKLLCIVQLTQALNQQCVQFVSQDTFCIITHVQNSQLNVMLLTQMDSVCSVLQVLKFKMELVFKLKHAL